MKELIVVGCGPFIPPAELEGYGEVKVAASCQEAARLIANATDADLVDCRRGNVLMADAA